MVEHVVHVHLSVGQYSKEFLAKLRRINHVTPKNYLDFINTYTKLLQEKDKFVQDQVREREKERERESRRKRDGEGEGRGRKRERGVDKEGDRQTDRQIFCKIHVFSLSPPLVPEAE